MDDTFAILADNLFSATDRIWQGNETLSNQALSNGIEKYQNEDYRNAAKDFQQAFRLSPYSSFAYEATKYAAMSYQALGETDKAIGAYEQAIGVNQTDDRLQLEMGNLLFGQKRYSEAIESYEAAVRLYDDPTNRYSLGQAYIQTERFQDAENQFRKIIRRGGLESRNGYYGLGQNYRAQGQYDDAIEEFERAFSKDREFYSAYEQMGYTYADADRLDDAKAIQDFLETKDAYAAVQLSSYISKASQPKILLAYADSSFLYYMRPKTELSVIDSYLATAGATKSFAMTFQFNKEMDRESIENVTNWSITRSTQSAPGMRYNNGLAPPDTEISVPYFPSEIYYDEERMTATIRFNLTQNTSADGTIDPSHIVFSFNGQDADGNEMHNDYDQFMGFSKSF